MAFENFAPTRKRVPYVPLYDAWVEDLDLLEFEPARGALVHRRGTRKLWPFGEAERDMTPEDFQALVSRDLAETELPSQGPGVTVGFVKPDPHGPVLVLGADRAPDGHQCGPVTRRIPRRRDAFRDAADGELRGDARHKGRSTGALRFPLAGDEDRVAVMVSLGTSPARALAALDSGREQGAAALRAETEAHWRQLLGRARLPEGIDARERAVLLRTLATILQAQDPETGLIVASISAQPPYAQDWPRDGAFLDLVLDWAGFHEQVTRHKRFYARVQRREDRYLGVPGIAQPRGTFEMSYYADGAPGGPFVFEIDNTALTVWGWVEHARYLRAARGDAAADAYLAELWPAIERAVSALAAWRDPETGLHKPAFEDDVPKLTQLIQGAGAVHLALGEGLEAAARLGAPAALRAGWAQRREELGAAILDHLYDPEVGFSREQGPGAVAWLTWPARFLPLEDPRMQAESTYLWESMRQRLAGEEGGGAYEQKQLMSLLYLHPDHAADPVWGPRLSWAYRLFVDRIPNPGTLHLGETYHTFPDPSEDDGLRYENRTSVPHVWAASLVYLSSILYHHGQVVPPGP